MAAKIALIFLAAFVLFQFLSTEATIIRREATTEKNDLEDAWNSVKQGFEEFVQKVEGNELFQNASKVMADFGQKIKQQGDDLIKKIQSSTQSPAH